MYTVDTPKVDVEAVQEGSGNPLVFKVETNLTKVNPVLSIALNTQLARVEEFSLDVIDHGSNQTVNIGPIYATTVATAAEEIQSAAPASNQLGAAEYNQPEGRLVGESVQSLFRSIPWFDQIATDVEVTKTEVLNTGSNYTYTWEVTFVHALNRDIEIVGDTSIPRQYADIETDSSSYLAVS